MDNTKKQEQLFFNNSIESETFCRNENIRRKDFQQGIEGVYQLPLTDLCIALTNRCNLYCLMCPFCSKDYKNGSYNNEIPFMTTLDEYKKILNFITSVFIF